MAASDRLRVTVQGRQTHGGYPWRGVDPIVLASELVLALQTVVSRQLDVTRGPVVLSFGSIHGGLRGNIVPDSVELEGTLRSYDAEVRQELHARIRRTATHVTAAAGGTAEVEILDGYPTVINHPELSESILPTLRRVAGAEQVRERDPVLGAEDFAFYQRQVPGVFLFLGIVPPGVAAADAPPNHSPRFFADEAALPLGVRVLAHLAVDVMRHEATRGGFTPPQR
jgi:amidohydrolase